MTHSVADDVLGKIARQQNELFRRIREGSLNPAIVSKQLQDAIQGNFGLQHIPVWLVVKQRRKGGVCYIDAEIQQKSNYVFKDGLSIGVGSDEYDVTLIRLKSSDLKLPGKNALEVCRRAQEIGLELCQPEITLHLALQYDMKSNERFVVPLYGFSDVNNDPGQCALFESCTPGTRERHIVSGMKPEQCGVREDVDWVFQLKRVWNSEK